MKKHYNIPVFLPELACPFRCTYCNQATISGHKQAPSVVQMQQIIESHLASIPSGQSWIEIAFFGGNFTGLPMDYQAECLHLAHRYVKSGQVNGIRFSTRPDYIDEEKLRFIADFGVTTIELGAQSLDEEVLLKSGRGHTAAEVLDASALIRKHGFRLGLQMMIGLPGDTLEKALFTAQSIIEAGADETRIYPCLVIHDTYLEKAYHQAKYLPLSLDEAVDWTAQLTLLFEEARVKIIRMGLFPSEELLADGYVAGPFHPAFKELVMTQIWKQLFDQAIWPDAKVLRIEVPQHERNFAIGYKAANKKHLLKRYEKVSFDGMPFSRRNEFRIISEIL